MSTIVIVSRNMLPRTHEPFQRFVRRYALARRVLGQRCYVVDMVIGKQSTECERGTAPGHSTDLGHYSKGFRGGETLLGWMEKNNGKYLWMYDAAEDYGGRTEGDD